MPSTSGLNDDNIIFETGSKEVNRLQLQHEIIKDAMDSLIKPPLDLSKPGLQILDQATADGIWLKDVAATAPAQHEYTGTDIEPYYPVPAPPHMTFFDHNMIKEWPVEMHGKFDLVHSRLALPGAGTTPPRSVVEKLVKLMKPGGWIQQTEMLYTQWPNNGPAMNDMWKMATEFIGFAAGGQSLDYVNDLQKWYTELGLENVEFEIHNIGIGKKAKSERMQGISSQSFLITTTGLAMGAKGAKASDPTSISFSVDELDGLPDRVFKELNEVGGNWQLFTIWAQKKHSG